MGEPTNEFLVGTAGEDGLCIMRNPQRLTNEQAIHLAAVLVAMAECNTDNAKEQFDDAYEKVINW